MLVTLALFVIIIIHEGDSFHRLLVLEPWRLNVTAQPLSLVVQELAALLAAQRLYSFIDHDWCCLLLEKPLRDAPFVLIDDLLLKLMD